MAQQPGEVTLARLVLNITVARSMLISLFCLHLFTPQTQSLFLVQNSLQLGLELLTGFLQVINLLGVRLQNKHSLEQNIRKFSLS